MREVYPSSRNERACRGRVTSGRVLNVTGLELGQMLAMGATHFHLRGGKVTRLVL
jgi:hypothetical protein